MNPLRYLYNALWGDPMANAYAALQDAMKDKARRVAEAEYHRIMVKFYTNEIDHIDPYSSTKAAWNFADACQKRDEQADDWEVENRRVEEASAKVEAMRARMDKIKESTRADASR